MSAKIKTGTETSRKQHDYAARALRHMKESCPNCAQRQACDNYLSTDFWIATFTRFDENGVVACTICPRFTHFMFRQSIETPQGVVSAA